MIVAVCLLFATAITVAATSGAPVQLALKANAVVGGARVMLADIVTFDDTSNGLHPATNVASTHDAVWQTLSAIDLARSPRPGFTDRYTRKEIERLMRARGLLGAVIWRGADAVRVERTAQVFDSHQIAQRAEAALRELLQADGSRVELQLSAPLPDLSLPTGRLELKARPMPLAQALHSRVTVWVDLIVDGAFLRSVTVPFNVRIYQPVLVAKHDLPKGTMPRCDALQTREVDVAALDSSPFPADCKLVQGSLKRSLTMGAPLLRSSLQVSTAVTQGDSVSLRLVAGALLLESRAVAISDGEIGERIRVRPSSSAQTIMAEVIAPGVVKVTE